MADNSSEQEPSIEEILASIRQIISDDDEDSNEETEVVENPVRHKTDDVLELTEEDLAEQDQDEEIETEEEPEPEPEEEPEPSIEIDMRDVVHENRPEPAVEAPNPVPSDILSSSAQSAALSSIGKLKSKMPVERSRSYDGVTLEDIVRELLHPMLREWMDDNLPPMVERIVQKELEKLARRAMDD
jgi:cell pole-organizing protein PopZ